MHIGELQLIKIGILLKQVNKNQELDLLVLKT